MKILNQKKGEKFPARLVSPTNGDFHVIGGPARPSAFESASSASGTWICD
jgi:hypothetical protein